MSFISAGFLLIIIVTAVIYYLMPMRFRWCLLLVMSFTFYATYGVRYMGYILYTILSSYFITRIMAVCEDKTRRRRWLILALTANFGLLVFIKYFNFTIININQCLAMLHVAGRFDTMKIIMPLGISFYTFQTMGYVIDVYHKKVEPEKNILKLALFTAFLPQLLQGPIGRFDRLAPQLFNGNAFDIKNVEYGAQRIAWGLAKKLILADRAVVISGHIFSNLHIYSGVHIVIGLLMYSVYIYCDFAGGIDVVIGAAEIFGIHLDENFRQPYFSKSVGEFWRRWHISLGTWMKDYVFYPFSISKKMLRFGKRAKKRFGNTIGRVLPICAANILIFFIVGVWHGAAWKYIVYGLYNGIIIAVSNLLKPFYAAMAQKCHIKIQSKAWQAVSIVRTFILVNIGLLFEVCAAVPQAFQAMGRVFQGFRLSVMWDGSLLKMGLAMRDYKILFVGAVILLAADIMKERGIHLRDFVAEKPLVVRWILYLILVFATAPFGYVGATTEFMYAQF